MTPLARARRSATSTATGERSNNVTCAPSTANITPQSPTPQPLVQHAASLHGCRKQLLHGGVIQPPAFEVRAGRVVKLGREDAPINAKRAVVGLEVRGVGPIVVASLLIGWLRSSGEKLYHRAPSRACFSHHVVRKAG